MNRTELKNIDFTVINGVFNKPMGVADEFRKPVLYPTELRARN